MGSTKPWPDLKFFEPELILLQNEEYMVAYGYCNYLREHCIAELWKVKMGPEDYPIWFATHPSLTQCKLQGLSLSQHPNINHDAVVELMVELGFAKKNGKGPTTLIIKREYCAPTNLPRIGRRTS